MKALRNALALALIILLSTGAISADDTSETSGPDIFSIASVDGENPEDANKVPLTEEEGFDVLMDTDVDLANYRIEAEIDGERFGTSASDNSISLKPRIHELEEGEHTLTIYISGSFGEKTASTTIDLVETPETPAETRVRLESGTKTAIPPEPTPSHQISLDMTVKDADASFFVDVHGEKGIPESIELTDVSMNSPWPGDASIEDEGIRVNVDGSSGPDRGDIVLKIDLDASNAYEDGVETKRGFQYTLSDESGTFGSIGVSLWARTLPVVLEKPDGERFITDKTGREWSKATEGIPNNEKEPAAYVSDLKMESSGAPGPMENGVWHFTFDPKEKDILSANIEGYAVEPVSLQDIDYASYSLKDPYVLELEEGATFEATLRDKNGEPLPNGVVVMKRTDGPEHVQIPYEAEAGNDGVTDTHLPPGTYEARPVAPTAIPGEKDTITLEDGEVTTRTYNLDTPEVVSSEIEHIGGTEPEIDDMEVDSIYYEGAILVQLKPEDAEGVSRQDVEEQGVDVKLHDLSSLGVDNSTELRLTLKMTDFEPDTLFWAAKDARWDLVDSSGDTATFEVELKPTEIQQIDGRHTGFGSSENTDWPTGSEDRADKGYETVVDFWLFDTSELPGSAGDIFSGMSVMTNAQKFGWPRVDGGELSIYMAAPGETAGGEKYTGFYQAFIPDHTLEAWNVEDPKSDLQMMWKGSEENFEVENVEGGVFIEIDPVEFSDGDMQMKSLNYRPPLLERIPLGSQISAVIHGLQQALSGLL